MKKVCVISDTHGRLDNIRLILPVINSCEKLIFLGDYTGDLFKLKNEITTDIVAVRGNCDLTSPYPEKVLLEWCGKRFFIAHGHKFGVKSDLLRIAYEAESENCEYVLYGHTHIASLDEFGGIKLVNPGSLGEPRFGLPSYCIITEEKGKIFTKIISM